MELGFVGLGRMGSGMARRLIRAGHRVVGYDLRPEVVAAIPGICTATSAQDLVKELSGPKVIWLELVNGGPTEAALTELVPLLSPGDLIVDGGTAHYRTTLARAAELREKSLEFVDVGISGGLAGAEFGYCLMAGGPKEQIDRIWPAMESMAVPGGAVHTGAVGSGHYAKMIHNAVTYGLMQAYVEGYHMLADGDVDLNVVETLQSWAKTGAARGFLLDKLVEALELDPGFQSAAGIVEDTGTGRWTIKESVDLAIPTPVLTAALFTRFESRLPDNPQHRALAAMRGVVGGHKVARRESTD